MTQIQPGEDIYIDARRVSGMRNETWHHAKFFPGARSPQPGRAWCEFHSRDDS